VSLGDRQQNGTKSLCEDPAAKKVAGDDSGGIFAGMKIFTPVVGRHQQDAQNNGKKKKRKIGKMWKWNCHGKPDGLTLQFGDNALFIFRWNQHEVKPRGITAQMLRNAN